MTGTGEIAPETQAQLDAAGIEPGRPLIAVDADEVLVSFVPHLARFMRPLGFEMRLVRYELEGSMFPIGSDQPLPFEDCLDLIRQFFDAETENQESVTGAPEALRSLSRDARIVVLTNVPRPATEARRRNLAALGMGYPLVVNSGGKGRAMRWLAERSQAPTAFVDDSVRQVESVARHAPDVVRLHFAEADFIARIFPTCEHANVQVRDWKTAETELRARLGLSPA